jgi:hypothetical protein
LSQHPNADGSIIDFVKIEAWGKFVSHQLRLAATSVVSLTVPSGVNQAVVQADGESLRITHDGTTPTTALGFVIPNGTSITLSASDATNAKIIAVASGGLVNAGKAGCPRENSRRSRFTLPHCRHRTRRTSNSKNIRKPPVGRSLARRSLRSYHPECSLPHLPQVVFFERRTRVTMRAFGSPSTRAPCPWSETQESDMHQANAVASLKSPGSAPRRGHPSPRNPRALLERHKPAIHGHFTLALTRNSPTRLHEDPFFLRMKSGA